MEKVKKIKRKNLPIQSPLFSAFLMYTALSYWQAPMWLFITFGVLYSIALTNTLFSSKFYDEIDIFDKSNKNK